MKPTASIFSDKICFLKGTEDVHLISSSGSMRIARDTLPRQAEKFDRKRVGNIDGARRVVMRICQVYDPVYVARYTSKPLSALDVSDAIGREITLA